ncbi:MAG: LytTR family transcriptional regulator [Bacteroides sp. SM23_62_1]|nr:MAG: LytTR family transcriptional regulator [Bacteroides sp. SM23_62_1]
MNCIIIEDDPLSVRIIQEFIRKTTELSLVHTFSNAIDAINTLRDETNIDLIFLDIELPDMDGMEFLDSLTDPVEVIIISSKGVYAADAFDYEVTDYLVKPITYARFYKAIQRARKRMERERLDKIGRDEIFIKKNSTLVRLKYDDILWIEALENYVIFNTFFEKFTIHFTMKAIEQKLPQGKFTRVHRSFIVNTSSIDVIEDNSVLIKVQDGTKTIPIGKSYKDKLMGDINLMIK